MSEEDDKLKSLGVVYAAYDAGKRRAEWGYRAAYLMFASFFLSTLFVILLEWVQPSHNPLAMIGLTLLLSLFAFIIGVGAFGVQPTGKRKE